MTSEFLGQFHPFANLSGGSKSSSVSAMTEIEPQRLIVGSADGQILMMSVCHSEYKKGLGLI